jgi:ATP-dependent Clp protease ATP-binding subunit ClpX
VRASRPWRRAGRPGKGNHEQGTMLECSFCGKRRHQVSGLAAAARAAICTECLGLCHEIIGEDLA